MTRDEFKAGFELARDIIATFLETQDPDATAEEMLDAVRAEHVDGPEFEAVYQKLNFGHLN